MSEIEDIEALREELFAKWDMPHADEPDTGSARFENAKTPTRPRGGLAIGFSVDKNTKKRRVELRVTAKSGPNYYKAQQIQNLARSRGFDAVLMVAEKPRVSATVDTKPKFAGRRLPLHIGTSISHHEATAGTLGAFVKWDEGKKTGFVSCGHVLARLSPMLAQAKRRKWGNCSDPVHQPGWPDQDPVVAITEVAKLHDFSPFVAGRPKNLDAAVARMSDVVSYEGNIIPDLPCVPKQFRGRPVGKPLRALNLEEELRVIKVGRTTGFTEAALTAWDFAGVNVEFQAAKGTENFTFFGVHSVLWDAETENDPDRRYSAPGDSGSLVMTYDGLRPIGLHFTSAQVHGRRTSYVVPWSKIETTFGVELI
jgi:hypothetical protein